MTGHSELVCCVKANLSRISVDEGPLELHSSVLFLNRLFAFNSVASISHPTGPLLVGDPLGDAVDDVVAVRPELQLHYPIFLSLSQGHGGGCDGSEAHGLSLS